MNTVSQNKETGVRNKLVYAIRSVAADNNDTVVGGGKRSLSSSLKQSSGAFQSPETS